MSRLLDWRERLDALINHYRTAPMVWGQTDCCQFALAAVRALTGVDHAHLFPAYSSEREALEIIVKAGGVAALVRTALGESKHPSRARHGDIVLGDWGTGDALGVCLGVETAVLMNGCLGSVRTLAAREAWTV